MAELAVSLPGGIRYRSIECPQKEILVVPRKFSFRPKMFGERFFFLIPANLPDFYRPLGGVVLSVFLRVLSILIIAAGAFLVYGAGFLTKRTVFGCGNNHQGDSGDESGNAADLNEDDNIYEGQMLQKSLEYKRSGLLLIMLGSILALIAFR